MTGGLGAPRQTLAEVRREARTAAIERLVRPRRGDDDVPLLGGHLGGLEGALLADAVGQEQRDDPHLGEELLDLARERRRRVDLDSARSTS